MAALARESQRSPKNKYVPHPNFFVYTKTPPLYLQRSPFLWLHFQLWLQKLERFDSESLKSWLSRSNSRQVRRESVPTCVASLKQTCSGVVQWQRRAALNRETEVRPLPPDWHVAQRQSSRLLSGRLEVQLLPCQLS